MKSNTLARRAMKGVHVSNYDIIRVLGKGSFGVVRLVREKSDNCGTLRGSSCSVGYLDGSLKPRNDRSSPKASLRHEGHQEVGYASQQSRGTLAGRTRLFSRF